MAETVDVNGEFNTQNTFPVRPPPPILPASVALLQAGLPPTAGDLKWGRRRKRGKVPLTGAEVPTWAG